MKRPSRPRATNWLGIVPALVTDRTAPAVLGLEPRVYRALVMREHLPHAIVARRVVCRVEDVVAVIDRMARDGEDEGEAIDLALEDLDADQPRSVADVLRKLGKERFA